MIKLFLLGLMGLTAGLTAMAAEEVEIGKPAPDFTLIDTNGKTNSLSDFKGKYIVLEWSNYDCPFVKKHYGSGNMQSLQKTYMGRDVIWLTINSSAQGKQGFYAPATWNAMAAERNAAPTAILLDPDGKVGRLYGAKTTPNMFIIDNNGFLIYKGAIDDKPSFDPETLVGAKNYVSEALDAAMSGKPVTTPATTPYGCGVKY